MTTTRFVNLLVSFGHVEYVERDSIKEFRRYRCNLDGMNLPYRSIIIHFRWRHRNIYDMVRKLVNERVEVKKDTVFCECGGHYKAGGNFQHELTCIHREWVLTQSRYPILLLPEQAITTLT